MVYNGNSQQDVTSSQGIHAANKVFQNEENIIKCIFKLDPNGMM